MHRFSKKAFFACSVGALVIPGVVGLSSLASARTVSAIQGTGATPADTACFDLNSGSIVNTCSGPATFMMSLVLDTAGTKTVTVNGMFPTGGAIQCAVLAADKAGNYASSPSWVPFTTPNVDSDLALPSVVVPSQGTLSVACQMSAGAELHSLRW